MKLIRIKCPECGAPLEVNPDITHYTCQYCGASVITEGDHFTYKEEKTYRKVDEARMREADVHKDVRFREIEHEEKNTKTKITLIIVGIVIVIGLALFFVKSRKNPVQEIFNNYNTVETAKEEISVNAQETVTVATVEKVVKAAKELISYKYSYTDIGEYEKNKKLFKTIKIPFTTDKTLYVYKGKINLGVKLDEIDISVDQDKKVINVTIPEVEIISNEVDNESFQFYDVKNSIFTKTDLGDFAELSETLQENQAKKVLNDDELMKEAKSSVENSIRDLLYAFTVESGYSINVSE